MEVPLKMSNPPTEGLIFSLVELHVISPEGLRLPRLSELSPKGLSVSFGRTKLKFHAVRP